jgi:chitinase
VRRVVLVACLAAWLGATPAGAYWSAGAGSGSGSAPVDTLGAGAQPTAGASGQTVTVSFAQTSFQGGGVGSFTGGGYAVRRYLSTGGAAITPSSTCGATVTGTAATLSCTETSTPFGLWRYTVTPLLRTWTGAESPPSAVVSVAPLAPTLTVAPAPAGNVNLSWTAVSGASGYNVYRRTAAGAYGSPLNGSTPLTGTSYADAATADGTTYLYVVRAVAPTPGGTIESADSNEGAAQADATGPTVALTSPGQYLLGTMTFSASAADAGSGVASVRIQSAPAGTSSWSTLCTASASPYSCSGDSTQLADGLYDLRALVTDGAGNQTASAVLTSRRVDNTAPAASMTATAAYLRATVSLTSTASDAGSGLASVKLQRSPAGAGTWTDICSGTTSASPCAWDTTAIADGTYDLRLIATDAAGNQGTSASSTVTVDNTKPTGTDIQTTNKTGGTAGRAEAGDVVTFSFSEPLAASSLLAGWPGTSTAVTVRLSAASVLTVYDSSNTTQLPLGSVDAGKSYALVADTFTNSTMALSGSKITITLGTASTGLELAGFGTGTLTWTTSSTPTDLAGNTLAAGTITESGAADLDF